MMRYPLLDEIRGLTLVSMLLYHGCWDYVYIFHGKAPWYETQGAYYWQQSICWTFIFLSGFCWHLGKRKIYHGLKIFLGGALITLVTLLFMPEDRVVFGVLTFLGSAALIVTLSHNIFILINHRIRIYKDMFVGEESVKTRDTQSLIRKSNQTRTGLYGWRLYLCFLISILLFILTKHVNQGYIGIGSMKLAELPGFLYRNYFTAFLGFPQPGFYSTDYFSLIPWIFLYLAGYYAYILMAENDALRIFEKSLCPALGILGRYSFWIYMVHQPVLYGVLYVVMRISSGG